jgi:hypothetical protein
MAGRVLAAQLAFVYRDGAEIERRNGRPGAGAQLAFVYRDGAEMERRNGRIG